MILKILGALLVIVTCGGLGFQIAAAQRREEQTLHRLISILDYMECELQYRLTPLPELCRLAAAEDNGILQQIFYALAMELEDQISPDVDRCMCAVLSKFTHLPNATAESLSLLGRSLGRFDLEGQLKGLEAVRQTCRHKAAALGENKETRLRSYQTLGLCAGAAIVILFI